MSRSGCVGGFVVLLLASLGLGSAAQAAEATVSLDVLSAYVWRGITVNDTGVAQFALDAGELKIGELPLSFNAWGNLDLGDADGAFESGQISEVDLTVTLGLPAGFSVGLIDYTYPAVFEDEPGFPATQELFVSWSKEMVVTPTVSLYYDVGEVDDLYGSVGLGWSRALNEKVSLDLSAQAGFAGDKFAAYYSGGTKSGFHDYLVGASLSYQANETVGLSAQISYVGSLDEEVLTEQDLGFFGGVGLAFTF
jgi:hypothetical protein